MDFENIEYKIVFFISSCLVWSTICAFIESTITFKSLVPKIDHDVKNRFVSIIHGVLTLFLAGHSLFYDRVGYTDKNSDVQHMALLISLGYFLYDLVACTYYDLHDTSLYIHHSLAMFGYIAAEYYNNSTIAMCGIFYAEVSNAPMHLRSILRSFGQRYTGLYESLDSLYIVSYMIARGIFMSYVTFETTFNSEIPLLLRFTCVGLELQSLYYIYEMFHILKRKAKQAKERKQKAVHYFWFSENPEIKKLSYTQKDVKDKVF